jgi:hypothetical protein
MFFDRKEIHEEIVEPVLDADSGFSMVMVLRIQHRTSSIW